MGRFYDEADTMRRKPLYPLGPASVDLVDEVKVMGQAFFDLVESLGPSRDASLAKTRIEEAVMWAVKHITA